MFPTPDNPATGNPSHHGPPVRHQSTSQSLDFNDAEDDASGPFPREPTGAERQLSPVSAKFEDEAPDDEMLSTPRQPPRWSGDRDSEVGSWENFDLQDSPQEIFQPPSDTEDGSSTLYEDSNVVSGSGKSTPNSSTTRARNHEAPRYEWETEASARRRWERENTILKQSEKSKTGSLASKRGHAPSSKPAPGARVTGGMSRRDSLRTLAPESTPSGRVSKSNSPLAKRSPHGSMTPDLAPSQGRRHAESQDSKKFRSETQQLKRELHETKERLWEAEERANKLEEEFRRAKHSTSSLQQSPDGAKEAQRSREKEEQRLPIERGQVQGTIEKLNRVFEQQQKSDSSSSSKKVKRVEAGNQDIATAIPYYGGRPKSMEVSHIAELEKFRAGMQKLQDDMATMHQALTEDPPNTNAYRSILQKSLNYPDGTAPLRVNLRKLVDRYTRNMADLSAQNQSLKHDLAEKEKEIKGLLSRLPDAIIKAAEDANDEITGEKDSREQDGWRKLYTDKSKRFDELQKRQPHLEKLANEHPQLERENEDLRTRLTAAEDSNARLRSQVSELREKAANWESEYKGLQVASSKRREEGEKKIQELNQEMVRYMEEYRDKTPEKDPGWWERKTLQQRVKDRERELEGQTELSESLKRQRDVSYEECRRLIAENEELRKMGTEEGFQVEYASAYPRTSKARVPRYESDEEIAERKQILEVFMKNQAKARAHYEKERRLVEKARKHKMGEWWSPNIPGYDQIEAMTPRERWEVVEYLEVAPPADRDLAAELGWIE